MDSMNRFFYRAAEKLRGERITQKLKELRESQYSSVQELRDYQREKLQELLRISKEAIPYYREVIKDPNPAHFHLLPILRKETIRKNAKRMFNPEIPRRNFIELSSSGTTGEPLLLFLERSTVGYYHAAQWRGFSWYGVEFGARGVKIWGVPVNLKSKIMEKTKDRIANRMRISAFNLEKVKARKIWEKILKFKPQYLYGYASALSLFASLLEENNLDGKELGLQLIVSTAECLYEFQRERLKKFFKSPLADEYGACEAGIMAFECPKGSLHLTAENVYLEIVDEDNIPREIGYEGKILMTSLRNFGFPLIRYELGDVGALSERGCTCGIHLPLIEKIAGRTSDFVVTDSGKSVHSEFFSYLNRELISRGYLLKEFKIVQKKKNALIVYLRQDTPLKEEIKRFLRSMIAKHIGRSIEVQFESVEKVDFEKSGKKRYFVNEIYS